MDKSLRRELGPAEVSLRHARASDPPALDRVAAWRIEMSPEDIAAFEAEAGDLLEELGYARHDRLAS